MLYVSFLTALPGKYADAVRCLKHPKIPEGVKIKLFVGLFGKPDALVVFEAPNEAVAAEFVIQFAEYCDPKTAVAFPVTDYKWTK